MLDEEKWLGITQGFLNLREKVVESHQLHAPRLACLNLKKNGISQPPEFYSACCNKENELESFDEQEISEIPQSQITSGGVKSGKNPLLPMPIYNRNGRKAKAKPEEIVKNAMGDSRSMIHSNDKYLDLNHVQQMEIKLRKIYRRLKEKSQQVEEQELIISELREKLRTQEIPETNPDIDQSISPENHCSGSDNAPDSKISADVILARLTKMEEKMETLIKSLPEKIETVCMQVLFRELIGRGGEPEAEAVENVSHQPKWNLLPSIKPKSNLATKLRTNFRNGFQVESKKDKEFDVEEKVASLENIVEQLKQSMFMMVLKGKKC